MSRYESIDCPICKKPLDNGGEIVVCPECGAPYHRSCFAGEGHCIFPELHERNEAWHAPRKEEKFEDASKLICSRCGSLNPPYGLFCQVCGNPLNNARQDGQTQSEQAQPGQAQPGQPGPYQGRPGQQVPPNPYAPNYPPFGGPGGPIPPQMPLNPYTTPFGGVAPDEEIDGVPAKDLAIFVGKNSHYFLPRFKQISQTKAKIVNWSAFLFEGGYFLYRKMYGLGILFLLLDVLLSLPQSMLLLQGDLSTVGFTAAASSASSTLTTMNLLCNMLSWAMRFVCGFFANSFYFSHCKRKISEERAAAQDNDQYYALLSKKGSVAVKLVTGLLIAYAVLYFLSVVLLLMTGSL